MMERTTSPAVPASVEAYDGPTILLCPQPDGRVDWGMSHAVSAAQIVQCSLVLLQLAAAAYRGCTGQCQECAAKTRAADALVTQFELLLAAGRPRH